ncbi:retrovirus-related pol polyprotein from transposon TNT 1-94 [Tanacetum coccineum]
MEVLHTHHMDLCGPMRVQSINGKKYILVIVDDYSRFTWVKFLGSKDETPDVVERQNHTLVEAARTMLIFSKAPMFMWVAAVATALFGAPCYPTNDSEDLGKLQAKADIGIFVGYAPSRKGLAPSPVPATTYIPPTDKDLEILFQPMFNEYFDQSIDGEPVPTATVVNAPIVSTNTSVSTTIAQDAPSTSHSLSSSQVHPPVFPQGVAAGPTIEDTSITQADLHPSVNPVAGEPSSAQSTSGDVSLAEPNQVNQPPDHLRKWTKDHPLDNIVGNPSRPVSTRKQLASDALWCCYHTVLSKVEPKNFKMAVNEDSWFEAMQDEIHEFDRLKCNRVLERQKKLRNQIFRALTASADVPSSVTETTDTTSTLPPPPPPLQKPTGHRDIYLCKREKSSFNIMNPHETEQVIARDELWVPTAERVNISTTNVRLETTVKQKEETFQVVIDVIKNSTCIKAFTISADVPEILMQQFLILDICPRKEGEDFTEVQNDEDTLTFLVDLGYSGPLHKYTNMFVDHMHQPWRTLAACINKCLSGKTASNDKLRKSRIDILWGMFYRENVDYPSLIWEDIAYQIDHRREKKSRRENMPYPQFTKVIIDYFLSKHKSLKKLKFQHFHTIKDDGVVSRLKFVRMGEDVQQYGLAIPATMLNKEIIQSESYKRFILYSTGQIPPKKSRGKGSQGKKSADPTEESVDMSDESEPEPLIRRKTSSRRVKKKATISVDDNIVPEPDIALELGKSISLTEAEEEAAARQVHATHARIVSESVPEPARRRRSDIAISETTQKLKGIQTLTPAEQEAADIMKALKDSRRMLGRQPGTGGSDEGTGEIPGVLDESIYADAEDDNEETESDSDDIYKYRINVRKNADTEMKAAEKTADITKETTEQPLTSSSFSVPSDYGNQFLNLSHNEEIFEQHLVLQQTTPIPTTTTTPPIITKAPAIIPEILEITPFIALQLRVAKLEQDMSEYLGTKLDDALLKTLERHTADLVEKYSMLPTPEEQEEKRQEPTYTIKSTDQAALEEFDLKSALFKSMHKNKYANRNPANYRLYHALIEVLIEDENTMDKEVAYMGKSTKKRRTRESESAKKPSTTKESSKDKDPKVGSKIGKSAPTKDPVEEPTDKVVVEEQYTEDILISDEGHVSDPEDTDNTHTPKISDTTTWFRPILEEERPASPEPEWFIPLIDLPEADNNWANAFAKAHQDQDENKLHNKIDDIGSFIRWYCRRIGKEELSKADLEGPAFMMVKGFHENSISLQFQMEECHKLLTNQIDLVNPEGHRFVPDISNPLPLGGPPGDKERNRALSISKLKAALYQDFGLEELVPSLWIESEQVYDIIRSHMRILSVISIKTYERYGYNYLREIVLRRADYNEYKISEKDFKSLHPNDFEDLNILHIQGKLDHLPKQDKVNLHNAVSLWTRNIVIRKRVKDLQLGIESYQTKLNLEQPNWDASDFPFKEDYTIVFKPRAVIYRDRDDNRKMMRIDEVHKFSDGTLTRIKEKLDFMVKDFKLFKFNKGMENRKWTEDDKRRSEDFIEVIERRLKIRRIFRSLESFVGGRLRDIDYRLISRTE